MLVKMNLADISVSSLLVLNQDNKLAPQVEKICFPLLLAFLSPPSPLLPSYALGRDEKAGGWIRKQEAE